jgi:8-oxo-dGTP pyrophosphatase MutT (NUDIX family)
MAEQLFQIGIKALIRNNVGEILMVYIPNWGVNPGHWDFPGGRMDPGEKFLDTLGRELQEEIGVTYSGTPKQLAAMVTNITIPVGDIKYPLAFVVYEVTLPKGAEIVLDPDGPEKEFGWFSPKEAAVKMATKFPDDFCKLVSSL